MQYGRWDSRNPKNTRGLVRMRLITNDKWCLTPLVTLMYHYYGERNYRYMMLYRETFGAQYDVFPLGLR